MKHNQRIPCFLLAAVMILGIFSGCRKAERKTDPSVSAGIQQTAQNASVSETGSDAEEAESGTAAGLSFTDDAGRTVDIPAGITRVAPSGAVATMFLATVCPEYMVCINIRPDEGQRGYLDEALFSLPETGQLYGGRGNLNLETLLNAGPQIVIDLGDRRKGIDEDLDIFQEQTGIPVIFIEADLPHMADAFRKLGSVLEGKDTRCAELAAYVDETVQLAEDVSSVIGPDEKLSVMYTTGPDGLDTNASGSAQAQVIELVGAVNAVAVEEVSSKSGGNPVNMEQAFLFDPDAVIFSADSMYDYAADDPGWSQLRAVREGRYCEIPDAPYNWMSGPPSLNMLLGVRWLGNLLYPRYYQMDMIRETQRAYKVLWNCELTEDEAAELLARASFRE